jgi:hypothetical protein
MPKMEENTSRTKRNRAKRPKNPPRLPAVPSESGRRWSTRATLIAGATGVAAGAAGVAAILMRRQMAELATQAATDAMLARRAVEGFGKRLLGRRPSLLSRAFSPMGIATGLVVAAGSVIFLMAPKPEAASQKPPKPERGEGASPVTGPSAESRSDSGVIDNGIADVVENGAKSLAGS